MPHKRAKRSVRDRKRSESGNDLAPAAKKALESEEIPKSVARVLNAAKIQREHAEKKRKSAEDDGAWPSRKKRKGAAEGEDDVKLRAKQLRIMPGESMAHFNRRVEDSMRGSVQEAMQTSSAHVRKMKKEEMAASQTSKKDPPPQAPGKSAEVGSESEDEEDGVSQRSKPKDFEKIETSVPKRLNDIVQAPPEIKKLPRKAKKLASERGQKEEGAKSLREGVMSMAQKAKMEEERERAIRLYREMKRGKLSA